MLRSGTTLPTWPRSGVGGSVASVYGLEVRPRAGTAEGMKPECPAYELTLPELSCPRKAPLSPILTPLLHQ